MPVYKHTHICTVTETYMQKYAYIRACLCMGICMHEYI